MEIIYYHKPFSKHCNKPLSWSFLISFGGLTLQVEFGPFFFLSYYDREFDMETDVFG